MLDRYRDLTKRQTEVLGLIATGDTSPASSPTTLKKLVDKGLIVKFGRKTVGVDVFGKYTVPMYEMPIAEHIAWCEWCSEQCKSREL